MVGRHVVARGLRKDGLTKATGRDCVTLTKINLCVDSKCNILNGGK